MEKTFVEKRRKAAFLGLAITSLVLGILFVLMMSFGNGARAEFEDGLAQLAQSIEEGEALLTVAQSTSRIGLGPVVADMTGWERDLNDLELPDDLMAYRDAIKHVGVCGRDLICAFMAGDENTNLTSEVNALEAAIRARDSMRSALNAQAQQSVFAWGFHAIFGS
jgi:hypothetical protein